LKRLRSAGWPEADTGGIRWLRSNTHWGLLIAITCSGCERQALDVSPMPQKAYVWQRIWTPEVRQSVQTASAHLDGLVILGAHIRQKASSVPECEVSKINWADLASFDKPIGLALRMEGPVPPEPIFVARILTKILNEAKESKVSIREVQVDYDSPEHCLKQYAAWLGVFRRQVPNLSLSITAIPAWLNHPDCARVFREVPQFVLQVHSVPTRAPGERVAIFEPERALRWVREAERFGIPFQVSLPTYGALLGYDADGKYLGMALDGSKPAWPRGTRIRELHSNADELACFSAKLSRRDVPHLAGLFWYRLPVGHSEQNWKWPTFRAVLEGRSPRHALRVHTTGDILVDVSLENAGESEEKPSCGIRVECAGARVCAVEALPGWEAVQRTGEVLFHRTNATVGVLRPESRLAVGWIRFDKPAVPHAEMLH